MSAMNAQYFAALSISSLASDDRSVSIDGEGSYISNSALYQQLSNIEDITANFILRKPTVLNFKHGVYSEVEYDNHQDFEFHLPALSQHELVSICVKCLPNFTVGEPLSLHPKQDIKVGENHCALIFNLERRVANKPVGENIPFKATLTNGEYTIVLSSSAKVVPGTYLLSVGLADVGYYNNLPSKVCADVHAVQAVRVQLSKTKTVRTIPLETGVTVSGSASFRDMCYYRFVAADPRHMITICAVATAGSSGDADLFVSNRFQGQVAVTRDNYVWCSVNSGVNRIDILPNDANLPADVKEGRIFVIGVASSGEETDFELTVTTAPPPPYTEFNFAPSAVPHSMAPPVRPSSSSSAQGGRTVINCAERGCTLDLTLVEDEYLHFAVRLPDTDQADPRAAGSSIVVLVHDSPGLASVAHATVVQQVGVPALLQAEQVVLQRGLGVHSGDTLAAQGLLPTTTPSGSSSGRSGGRGGNTNGMQPWNTNRRVGEGQLWPVVYASADVLFPDRECYTWRASSAHGRAVMFINPAEWKYARPVCYFSIHGHSLMADGRSDAVDASTESGRRKKAVRLSLWRVDAQPALPKAQQLAQEVIGFIYENVDAQLLSLADRKYDSASHAVSPHLRAQDDHNVTYFETDYVALVQLLQAAGAANGQVFYDLGCGSGRALLSAALSGIRFVKCVGVEVLPSLASAAQSSVNALTRSHDTSSGEVFRTPRSATPTPTPGQAPPGAASASKAQQDQRVRSRLDLLNVPLPAMEIWLDNMLAADWSEADFVYAASLCFSDSVVHQLLAQGARLRVGARLVTLKLTENYHQWFALEKTVHVSLSCGSVPAYVLLRVAPQQS